MKKVLLIFGGNSQEHYISCKSAKAILENIDISKFIITSVGISKDNRWFIFDDKLEYLEDGTWLEYCQHKEINNIIEFIKDFDIVFPIIHGTNGEDGKIQGMLELFHIKYVGCGTLASAIGMDKDMTKRVFNSINIPQVPSVSVDKNFNCDSILKKLRFPLIIKPANGGSSIGISVAHNIEELSNNINYALKFDQKVIVENFIKGRELECSVIEDCNNLYVSTIGEILPCNDFYDYEAKYKLDSKTIIPATLEIEIANKIKEIALQSFKVINARGMARIDFFLVDNNIYLNEINTLPGFTTISMYPKLLTHDKYRYKDIISILIENGLNRY